VSAGVEQTDSGREDHATTGTIVVVDRREHGVPLGLPVSLPVYLTAIVLAEVLVAFVDPLAGALVDAVVLLAIANHLVALRPEEAAYWPDEPDAPYDVLQAVALVAILRLTSLSLPLTDVPQAYWPLIAGVPAVIATALVATPQPFPRALRPARTRLGRLARARLLELQLGFFSGVGLGLLAYAVIQPSPLASTASWPRLIAASLGVVVFAGVLEEVIFRGLLQSSLRRVLGRTGVLVSCGLFAAVYLGTDSVAAIAFFSLVGLAFAVYVERTRSLLAVAVAHGVLALGLLVVWPLALG
jgi:membrane protease YdiL (CAAX protease family)